MLNKRNVLNVITRIALVLLLALIVYVESSNKIVATKNTYTHYPELVDPNGASLEENNYFKLIINWTTTDGLGSAANDDNAAQSYISFQFGKNVKIGEVTYNSGFRKVERIVNSTSGETNVKVFFKADTVKTNGNTGTITLELSGVPYWIIVNNGATSRKLLGNMRMFAEIPGAIQDSEVYYREYDIPKGDGVITQPDSLIYIEMFENENPTITTWFDTTPSVVNPSE